MIYTFYHFCPAYSIKWDLSIEGNAYQIKNQESLTFFNCYKSDHRCHRTIAIHVQKSKLISSKVTENKENFFTIYLFIEVNLFSYLDQDQLTTLFLTGKDSLLQLSLSYI